MSGFSNLPYNVNTSHPLIPNSQEYIYYKKYISIHSIIYNNIVIKHMELRKEI